MDDATLSSRIARASVDAGIHPWHPQPGDLPPGLPVPPLQVYSALKWDPTDSFPGETWRLVIMLEQQVGSMRYWIPVELSGPNQPLQENDPEPDLGWKMRFHPQGHATAYGALEQMSGQWWPSLEHWWWDVPDCFKDYDPVWRKESDCYRCGCTGVFLWSLVVLPCPECRTTPVNLTRGWSGLIWVPAHTPERVPHAKVGQLWRCQGQGYVVEQVLGYPKFVHHPHNTLHVGLRRHEAAADPSWTYRFDFVPPGWGDHDMDSEDPRSYFAARGALTRRGPGPVRRFYRRIAGWFDYSLADG